jgi:hypothetical protein
LFFDIDGDGIRDPGEPGQSMMAGTDGTFSGITLPVPDVAGGTYPVEADIPAGGSVEAEATFTMTTHMWLGLSEGPAGLGGILIAGSGFLANTSGIAFIDLNHNGRHDPLEPSESLTTESNGSIWTFLTVPPKTTPGQYDFMVDCPIGLPIEESATFTVLP